MMSEILGTLQKVEKRIENLERLEQRNFHILERLSKSLLPQENQPLLPFKSFEDIEDAILNDRVGALV